MGRTQEELGATLSFRDFMEMVVFYRLDPWGEQRADMRAAQIAAATLAPHSKTPPDPASLLLFPEDRLDVPDDLSTAEQRWMLELKRRG